MGKNTSSFGHILPSIEQKGLHDAFTQAEAATAVVGNVPQVFAVKVFSETPGTYKCPSTSKPFSGANTTSAQPEVGYGSYAMCQGHQGPTYGIACAVKDLNTGMALYVTKIKRKQISDGTTKTLLIGEVQDVEGTHPASVIVNTTVGNRLIWIAPERYGDDTTSGLNVEIKGEKADLELRLEGGLAPVPAPSAADKRMQEAG